MLDNGVAAGDEEWPVEENEANVEIEAMEALVLVVERIWGLELTRREREDVADMLLTGLDCGCGAGRTVLWLTLDAGRIGT